MKILLIEPYYTGSHKKWAEGFKKYSSHHVKILSMKGQFWKWRMHGGAVTLAKMFNDMDWKPDLILSTDMLDLTTFLALTRAKSNGIPTAIYFHENQISYPWSPEDRDILAKRDNHYGFINYASALSADKVFFNSNFHMKIFLNDLKPFLKNFPDNNETDTIEEIKNKSDVLDLGLDFSNFKSTSSQKTDTPTILWNHRWEYDKNPELFFDVMKKIKDKEIDFNLIIIGESFGNSPKIFEQAKIEFEKHIIKWGYQKSINDYVNCLFMSDIIPVTSNHDFFGISVMEAVFCNVWPILPDRLSYKELFKNKGHTENIYTNDNQLMKKIEAAIKNIHPIRNQSLKKVAQKYDWKRLAGVYDSKFEKIIL
jgi:glycosyltransferase involved in cell wall biosynthesis